jgi:hypothetical protein
MIRVTKHVHLYRVPSRLWFIRRYRFLSLVKKIFPLVLLLIDLHSKGFRLGKIQYLIVNGTSNKKKNEGLVPYVPYVAVPYMMIIG